MKALGSYARLRDELRSTQGAQLLHHETGTRLGRSFNDVFAGLVHSAGLNYSGRPTANT